MFIVMLLLPNITPAIITVISSVATMHTQWVWRRCSNVVRLRKRCVMSFGAVGAELRAAGALLFDFFPKTYTLGLEHA